MSNANEFDRLIPTVKEMLSNQEIRDFWPVLREILHGCEVPDYDNIFDVEEEFQDNNSDYVFRKISEAACQNAAMLGYREKRRYEY